MRHVTDRLSDVLEAIRTIRHYVSERSLDEGLVFDAVRMRLVEIGEAVKSLPSELLRTEPEVDWAPIARFRDRLAHRYWDTDHAVVSHIVGYELDALEAAIGRMLRRVDDGPWD